MYRSIIFVYPFLRIESLEPRKNMCVEWNLKLGYLEYIGKGGEIQEEKEI